MLKMAPRRLVIATGNVGKLREFRSLLAGLPFELTSSAELGLPSPEETGATFLANALLKARHAANLSASAAVADDSGLEVDALNGAPGIYSARYAGEGADDAANNAKLLRLLKNVPADKCTARFRCVIALTPVLSQKAKSASPVCYADELELPTQLFDGACEGQIIFEPRGGDGFGYDPLFVPNGFDKTFAELGDDVKNQLSHRAKALEKLKTFFQTSR